MIKFHLSFLNKFYFFIPAPAGIFICTQDDDTSRGPPFAPYFAEAGAVYAVFLSGSEELL